MTPSWIVFFILFVHWDIVNFSVVQQFYESRVIDEFVLRGNTATLKCLLPSFVADFVEVIEWVSTEDGTSYRADSHEEKGNRNNPLNAECLRPDYQQIKKND